MTAEAEAPAAPNPLAWMTARRCVDMDPETFFPTWGNRGAEKAAKRACNGTPAVVGGCVMGPSKTEPCPVREQCLALALEYERGKHGHDRFGVWGGLTPYERAALDPVRRPVADDPPGCPRPGRALGLERHATRGEEPCEPCYAHELKQAGLRRRDERICRMAAEGKSPWQIALSMGLDKSDVKRILARHADEKTTA